MTPHMCKTHNCLGMEPRADGDSQAKESWDGAGDVEGNLHEKRRSACNYSLFFAEPAKIYCRMSIPCNGHLGRRTLLIRTQFLGDPLTSTSLRPSNCLCQGWWAGRVQNLFFLSSKCPSPLPLTKYNLTGTVTLQFDIDCRQFFILEWWYLCLVFFTKLMISQYFWTTKKILIVL